MLIAGETLLGAVVALLLVLPGVAIATSPDSLRSPGATTPSYANSTSPWVPPAAAWSNSTAPLRYSAGIGPYASSWGTFGAAMQFGGLLQLTGGSVDAGRNVSGSVKLTPAPSFFNFTFASYNVSVSLPSLLGYDQTIPIVHDDFETEIPYLGSFTWADISLDIEFTLLVRANATVSGCGTGAGPISWHGGGSYGFSVCAAGMKPGDRIISTLSGIEFAWAIQVLADATFLEVDHQSLTIVGWTPVYSFTGSVSQLPSSYRVVPPPTHLTSFVTPNPSVDGETVSVLSNVSGGVGSFTYLYGGDWPGSDCYETDADLTCTATSSGTFPLKVVAMDQDGAGTVTFVNYTEAAPPTQAYSNPLQLPQMPPWQWALLGIGVLVGLGLIFRPKPRKTYWDETNEWVDMEFTRLSSSPASRQMSGPWAAQLSVARSSLSSPLPRGSPRSATSPRSSQSSRKLPPRDARGRFVKVSGSGNRTRDQSRGRA